LSVLVSVGRTRLVAEGVQVLNGVSVLVGIFVGALVGTGVNGGVFVGRIGEAVQVGGGEVGVAALTVTAEMAE
jgi:hypothetical protein